MHPEWFRPRQHNVRDMTQDINLHCIFIILIFVLCCICFLLSLPQNKNWCDRLACCEILFGERRNRTTKGHSLYIAEHKRDLRHAGRCHLLQHLLVRLGGACPKKSLDQSLNVVDGQSMQPFFCIAKKNKKCPWHGFEARNDNMKLVGGFKYFSCSP